MQEFVQQGKPAVAVRPNGPLAMKINIKLIVRRFFMPRPVVSIYYYLKYRARVSHRAEVELSPTIKLGRNVTISSFGKFKATSGSITIGDGSGFATSAFVTSSDKGVRIGKNCIFGSHVVIVDSSYSYSRIDIPYKEQPIVSKGIEIGDNVFVGSNVTIADGSQIGDNCVIVANSFVNRRFPPNCIIQGSPAKIIQKRQ